MIIPDGDIDVLARDMIKHFLGNAADQAALRSNAFFVLGYIDKSKKWLLVTEVASKSGISFVGEAMAPSIGSYCV
jgi:hypothetical protein